MPDAEFAARVLTETATIGAGQIIEITFVAANGDRLKHSLPVRVAADALVSILSQLSSSVAQPPGAPLFSQNVVRWQVGSSTEQPKVLLRLNEDPPYALHVSEAKKLWRELREEAGKVERRPQPTRQ